MTENFHRHDSPESAYLSDRDYYEQLGKDIATIISRSVSETELRDIQSQLLMLAINKQPPDIPTHIKALLLQMLSALQSSINGFKKDTP